MPASRSSDDETEQRLSRRPPTRPPPAAAAPARWPAARRARAPTRRQPRPGGPVAGVGPQRLGRRRRVEPLRGVAEPGDRLGRGSRTTIGSTKERTIAGAELISARPMANAAEHPERLQQRAGRAARPSDSPRRRRRGRAACRPTRELQADDDEHEREARRRRAPSRRSRGSRRGTSVNVVSAVRCDHSLVTARMPSTGSRISW